MASELHDKIKLQINKLPKFSEIIQMYHCLKVVFIWSDEITDADNVLNFIFLQYLEGEI